jgi:DNA-directed RNA polymerase subunit RPC12/RpoP
MFDWFLAPKKKDLGDFIGRSIPEPTRSLLWVTDDDPRLARSASSITISVSISAAGDGVNVDMDDGKNFYGEQSLIWSKLPIEPNDELEKKPMYYPSYVGLSPSHRYQYLSWLCDVEQRTNLSYVFLYYYGLECQMLTGNYDAAVDEILRLIRTQDDKLKSYVVMPLISASVFHKRPDIFERAPFLLNDTSNASLVLKARYGGQLSAKDAMNMAGTAGFSNQRYLKMYPRQFERVLGSIITDFEVEHGSILSIVPLEEIEYTETSSFLNTSIPDEIRGMNMPHLMWDNRFREVIRKLLSVAHLKVKELKQAGRIVEENTSTSQALDTYQPDAQHEAKAPDPTTNDDDRKPICPACDNGLSKIPGRKTKCPHCGKFIFVRTSPKTNKRVLVTEAQAAEIDAEYALMANIGGQELEGTPEYEQARIALNNEAGSEPSDQQIKWRILTNLRSQHAQEGNWGLFRNDTLLMGDVMKGVPDMQRSLEYYLQVCYLDVNGPSNTGGYQSTEFPAFSPDTGSAFVAPAVIDYIKGIAETEKHPVEQVKQIFMAANRPLHKKLGLPLSPQEAWPKLEAFIKEVT